MAMAAQRRHRRDADGEVVGQSARWSLSASSSAACSSAVIVPTCRPMRSTVIDLTCSACAFESAANPVSWARSST